MTASVTASQTHAHFSAAPAPAATVAPGAIVEFETLDTRAGSVLHHELFAPFDLGPPPEVCNPVSGPVGVVGATRAHSLAVTILDIACGPKGWCGVHTDAGLISPGIIRARQGRTCEVSDTGVAITRDLVVPLRPMIGCLGTAPAGPVDTLTAGRHGGNMDQTVVTTGATVLLPITHERGLLFVGDVHAAQGDGELSSAAVEVPATVRLKLDLAPAVSWPWVAWDDRIAVMTAGPDFEAASRFAVEEWVRVIGERGYSAEDALTVLSAAGDLRVGAAHGGPVTTVRLELPTSLGFGPRWLLDRAES